MTNEEQGLNPKSGMLAGFNEADFDRLLKFGKTLSLDSGDTLFTEGDNGTRLYIILSGEVDIRKHTGDKESGHTITSVGAGNMLGELSLVDGKPYSATAVAAEPVSLLVLSHEDLDSLLNEYPAISLQILNAIAKVMAQRLRATTERLVDQYELATEIGSMAPYT